MKKKIIQLAVIVLTMFMITTTLTMPVTAQAEPSKQETETTLPVNPDQEETEEKDLSNTTNKAILKEEVYTYQGHVYNDTNKNGKQDKGEEGIADIAVKLYEKDASEATYEGISKADGSYEIKGITAGSYKIEYDSLDDKQDLGKAEITNEEEPKTLEITEKEEKQYIVVKDKKINKDTTQDIYLYLEEQPETENKEETTKPEIKEETETKEKAEEVKKEETKENKKDETKPTLEGKEEKKQETKKQEATVNEAMSLQALTKLAQTEVGAARDENNFWTNLRSAINQEDWTFDTYYVNEKDDHTVTKTDDFHLKYQMEFHSSVNLETNAVEIRIPNALLTDRNKKAITPSDIAVPKGSVDAPVKSTITSFNYYIDGNDLVFFNYEPIKAGTNAAFQVLYKNLKAMEIIDGTTWNMIPTISVNNQGTVETKPIKALSGTVDTTATLSTVSKQAYTIASKSYGPGLYTKRQVESIISGSLPSEYANNFEKYRYVVWEIKTSGTANQPWDMYLYDTSKTEDGKTSGTIVGFDRSMSKGTGSYSSYYVAAKATARKQIDNKIKVVVAYPADKVVEGTIVKNNVEVVLVPADLKDSKQTKTAEAKWSYINYEWKYTGNVLTNDKTTNKERLRSWLDVYKAAATAGEDVTGFNYFVETNLRGYSITHETVGDQLGQAKTGMSYSLLTTDDVLYAYAAGTSLSEYKMLGKEDYYFSNVDILQSDTGYDPWEDMATSPETAGSLKIYAMYEDGDIWEEAGESAWQSSGKLSYQFTKEQIARKPYRVKAEHETTGYSTSCSMNVTVVIKHDSPVFAKFLAEGKQEVTIENLSGSAGIIHESGSADRYLHDQAEGNYKEPGLKEKTMELYGYLLQRDQASVKVTTLEKQAKSYKTGKSWNDAVNGQVHIQYNITANDGYALYGEEAISYLKEEGIKSPGRKEVVFYDLLPYGMRFDPSVEVVAGRIKDLTNSNYQNYPSLWDQKQVKVSVDSETDIDTNYRGSGRTRVAFHISYEGSDPAVYANGNWFEGWGVSFQSYYAWKDADIANASENISAFMPAKEDNEALLGTDSEVMKDDGTPLNNDEAYKALGADIDGDGNREERTVLYAKAKVSDDMAIASTGTIEKKVRADADRFGSYEEAAVVALGEGYTYDITVRNTKNTLKDIVVFDALEEAPEHVGAQDQNKVFDQNWWYGEFDGVITTGLEKAGIKPVIYYNAQRDAKSVSGSQEAGEVLIEANGWIEASKWSKELKEVKAVAVDMSKKSDGSDFGIVDMGSVTFQIHMVSPKENESLATSDHSNTSKNAPAANAYNNAGFTSKNVEQDIRQYVIGNAVEVSQAENKKLEIIKAYKGEIPESAKETEFQFTVYKKNKEVYANKEYELYKKVESEWKREGSERVYASDASGRLYLHADEKAVFTGAEVENLEVEEEENVYWKVEVSEEKSEKLKSITFKNEYRPVLYVQKKVQGAPSKVDTKSYEFTMQLTTNGSAVGNVEYWYVDSIRTDGGIPKKLKEGKTDREGKFKIKVGEYIALFPGVVGTDYKVEETETGNDWIKEKGEASGSLSVQGNTATISNLYKWKSLYLSKKITHQEASNCKEEFTFEVRSKGEVFVNARWVLMEDGKDTDVEGVTDSEGRFQVACAGKTIRIEGFEAGESYEVKEIVKEGSLYQPVKDTVSGDMPLYAEKKEESITNDYILRDLKVEKMVSYSTSSTVAEIETINQRAFEMQVKIAGKVYGNQTYSIQENGGIKETGTTDSEGKFKIKNGQIAIFKEVGAKGISYEVIETQDVDYPQLFPSNQESSKGSIEAEGSSITIINGTQSVLIVGKDFVVADGDNGQGQAYVDKMKSDTTTRNKELVKFYLQTKKEGGTWQSWPTTSSVNVTVIDTLKNTKNNSSWYSSSNGSKGLYPWEKIIIDSLDEDTEYRLYEDTSSQQKLYQQPDGSFLEITQKTPENKQAITGVVKENSQAIIVNQAKGWNATSEVKKDMVIGSNAVPTGAKLVYRVEQYSGSEWKPASDVTYVPKDTSGVAGTAVLKTDENGELTLLKTANGYPSVVFTDVKVEVHPKEAKEGAYRIVEIIEKSDESWGILAGYFDEDGKQGVDIFNASGFVNSNRKAYVKIAKEMEEKSDQSFTMVLKHITSATVDEITDESQILTYEYGKNMTYDIYDSESKEQIGTGTTTENGELKLKAGQYAMVGIPDKTNWTVSEKMDSVYQLKEATGTIDTKKIGENLISFETVGKVIPYKWTVVNKNPYIEPSEELLPERFEVKVYYSDGSEEVLDTDRYTIDTKVAPSEKGTVFKVTITNSITKENYVLALRTLIYKTISLSDVNKGVIDAETRQLISLKESNIVMPGYIIETNYNGEEYYSKIVKIYTSSYDGVFYNNKNLQSIVLPETLDEIDPYLFRGCTSLTSITLPTGITSIGNEAFARCSSLTTIDIPENVKSIGNGAFSECSSLSTIDLPQNITAIASSTFKDCNTLTSIGIPENVTNIGESAFVNCTGLTSIKIPKDIVTIEKNTFGGCISLTTIVIPEGVTSIESLAFSRCSGLTTIDIPEGVTNIESSAFSRCSGLTTIDLPQNITVIANSTFEYCNALTSIGIPENVTSIGTYAFSNCSNLSSIYIPKGVTSIGNGAFSGCSSLTAIDLPQNITVIASSTFKDCKALTSIGIPENVTSIGYSAFSNCSNLSSIYIPKGVTSIGESAFYYCANLTTIDIPENVTTIESSTFYSCGKLTTLTIPENVTSIGDSAFRSCVGLTSINIPKDIVTIEKYTFSGCINLTAIDIPEGVTSIGESAFANCKKIKKFNLPKNITVIASLTFEDCKALTSIDIPEGVTMIGLLAFSGCDFLQSVILPESLISLGDRVFEDSFSLKSITIPSSVTSIGTWAFRRTTANIFIKNKHAGDISGAPWESKGSVTWELD